MPLISASVDILIFTVFALFLSYFWFGRRLQARKGDAPIPPRRSMLNALVFLHTFYILYCIILTSPPNIFSQLQIPLSMPVERIRSVLLESSGYDANAAATMVLPRHLEALLTRLSSFETRTIYVRFGQSVVQDCEFCAALSDYALYALPLPLLQYIRTALAVGLVTIHGSHLERWRPYGVVALVACALAEVYWISTVAIAVSKNRSDGIMWHDLCWFLRHIMFLILPPVIHMLPASPPTKPPLSALPGIATTVESVFSKLTLLRHAQSSAMRDPVLRSTTALWWDRERRVGAEVRSDPAVRSVADRLGLGIDEGGEGDMEGDTGKDIGKLRENARLAVQALKSAFVPTVSSSES